MSSSSSTTTLPSAARIPALHAPARPRVLGADFPGEGEEHALGARLLLAGAGVAGVLQAPGDILIDEYYARQQKVRAGGTIKVLLEP